MTTPEILAAITGILALLFGVYKTAYLLGTKSAKSRLDSLEKQVVTMRESGQEAVEALLERHCPKYHRREADKTAALILEVATLSERSTLLFEKIDKDFDEMKADISAIKQAPVHNGGFELLLKYIERQEKDKK